MHVAYNMHKLLCHMATIYNSFKANIQKNNINKYKMTPVGFKIINNMCIYYIVYNYYTYTYTKHIHTLYISHISKNKN